MSSRVMNKMSKQNILSFPKIKSNFFKKGEYVFTKDGVFAIQPQPPDDYDLQTHSDVLYVRNDFQIVQTSALANLISNNFIVKTGITKDLTINKLGIDVTNNYIEYTFYRPLIDERKYKNDFPIKNAKGINENDCLKFGECITVANQTYDKPKFDQMITSEFGPPVLQSSATNKIFGVDENENIKLLKTIPTSKKNNFAVPKNGESYAIVRKQLVLNAADYHIAFVLYTHNNVNITLEAEADNKNNYMPRFGFYDITPNGKTFYRRWSAELYKNSPDPYKIARWNSLYNNGETIVLKSRNINDVIKEVDAENLKNTNVIPSPTLNIPVSRFTRFNKINGGRMKQTKRNKNKSKKFKKNKK